MRKHCLPFAVCGFVLFTASFAQSAEPYMKFLQGLRALNYYEYAIFYLDQIEADPETPTAIKTVLPYERALTHLAKSKTSKGSEAKNKELDLALGFLEQFVKDNARHELLGQANSQRAKILLERAKVEIFESRSPSNQESRGEYQKRARDLIVQAKKIFQDAFVQHTAIWEAFPKYIDKLAEPERFAAREKANVRCIQDEYDLALCSYWDAQTFDSLSTEQKKRLTTASTDFDAIHTKHRTVVAGLYARMWQGKCFEEQDDIKRAIGIYNELLGHDDKKDALKSLQNHVRRYRLICLNHKDRHDYVLARDEADTWLKANRALQRDRVGLAIRWELARAEEFLVDSQREMKESERTSTLRSALENYRFVNRYPGEFKDLALFKTRELMVKLNKGDIDPTDFDTAFGLGRDLVKRIDSKKDAVAAAEKDGKPKEEIDKLKEDERQHLKETARILKLALDLADSKTEIRSLNESRYFLSYVYLLQGRRYESAILSEFVAMHYSKGDSAQTAQDAAYLALAAYVSAYNKSPSEKPLHLKLMERMGTLIVDTWPNSDRANDARLQLGRNYSDLNRPIDAAKWFGAVPVSSGKYSRAQLQAGQSFWAAYLRTFELPDEAKPAKEELSQWQVSAEKHLRTGIDKTLKEIPATGDSPALLIGGKVSLVQILITQGKYQEGIDILTNDPHPVTKAIVVQDESQRPKQGVKSVAFASAVYQFLLRCYVGVQNLEKARETMKSLEKVVGGQKNAGGEAVTEVYKELGKELEKELKSLKAAGDTERLNGVRKSFESFLNDMFNRQDQTYSSLVWIAETYFGLGQGSAEDTHQAGLYFEKAGATYETIFDRIENKSIQGIDSAKKMGAKMRLVTCKRHEGQFDKAVELISDILAKKPRALDAQMEAARVFQSWAASGQADSWKKYKDAIMGGEIGTKKAVMWGWGDTAKRLQRLLFTGDAETKRKYEEQYFQARYEASYCRQQLGLNEPQTKNREKALRNAKLEILGFAAIAGDMEPDWWDKFDRLYMAIQSDLGETPVHLERRQSFATTTAATSGTKSDEQKPAEEVVVKTDDSESNLGLIVFAVLLFGGGGVGFFFMMKSQNKRPRVAYAEMAPLVLTPKKQGAPSKARTVRAKQARAKQQKPADGQASKPKQPKRKPPTSPQ